MTRAEIGHWSAYHQQQRTRTIHHAGPYWSGWSMARHLTHQTRPLWSGWRPARYLAYICAMHDHPGRAGTSRSIYKYITHVAGFIILSAAFLSVATLDTDSSQTTPYRTMLARWRERVVDVSCRPQHFGGGRGCSTWEWEHG